MGHPHFRYVIFQEEVSDSGTRHFQGYAEFKAGLRHSAVKKILYSAHWEGRRGSQADAMDYCRKEDTRVSGPYEAGTAGGRQGKRTDIDDAVELLISSRSIREVFAEHPVAFIKYHRGMQRGLEVSVAPRACAPKCILLYGPTGTGKSHWAFTKFPHAYWKDPVSKWFDGYLDEKTVVIDEFAGRMSKMELSYLLRLMDKYPLKVEVKGSSRDFLAETIIFTTNIHPRLWYDWTDRPTQWPALQRRFHEIWYLPTPMCEPMYLNKTSFFEGWFTGCIEDDSTYETVTRPNTPVPSDDEDDEAALLHDLEFMTGDQSDEEALPSLLFTSSLPIRKRVSPTRIGNASADDVYFCT